MYSDQWSAHFNVHENPGSAPAAAYANRQVVNELQSTQQDLALHGGLLTGMPAFAGADISHGFEGHTVDRAPTGQLNPSNFQSRMTLALPRSGFDANQQSSPVQQTPPSIAVFHAARPSNTWFEPGGVTAMHEKPIRTALNKRSPSHRPTSKRGQASSRTKFTHRGRQLNEDEKADAAAMRQLGVCVRCRLFHVKVGALCSNGNGILAYAPIVQSEQSLLHMHPVSGKSTFLHSVVCSNGSQVDPFGTTRYVTCL
jgi:hypothetical protein